MPIELVTLLGSAPCAIPHKSTIPTTAVRMAFLPARRWLTVVTLTKPFWLGKTELTQSQWKKVMGTEPWVNHSNVQIGEDNAASYVDWNDAVAFCQRLTDLERKVEMLPAGESYRLPTEAEWEYACRAGPQTA